MVGERAVTWNLIVQLTQAFVLQVRVRRLQCADLLQTQHLHQPVSQPMLQARSPVQLRPLPQPEHLPVAYPQQRQRLQQAERGLRKLRQNFRTLPLLRRRDGRASFLQQWHRLLIHEQRGTRRISGGFVGLPHVFPAGGELGLGLRRNHPVLELTVGQAVFLTCDARSRGSGVHEFQFKHFASQQPQRPVLISRGRRS